MSVFAEFGPFESWGRVVRRSYPIARPRFAADVPRAFAAADRPPTVLPVGLGRSYGDSCLNSAGGLIAMRGLDRLISIDEETLTLRAQAGLSLSEALQVLVPKGLFLPVLPGSRFVTLGGAVANDVHGKNHLRLGSFGAHVRAIGLTRGTGENLTLTPGHPSGLFEATIGGLGLTGAITWVEIGLLDEDSSFLDVEDIAFATLDDYAALMADSQDWEHRVAWIDCTRPGRGVFSRARFLDDGILEPHTDASRLSAPPVSPGFLLNGGTLKLFNSLYAAAKSAGAARKRQHYGPYFFPLDAIGAWNRLYGDAGFFQYQCVLPPATARAGVEELLKAIAESGEGSMLAVLKEFGPLRSPGLLSFPMEGTTLALDFRNRGAATLTLLDTLDAIVLDAGGRLYPAKDGRIPAGAFQAMYRRWSELEAMRDPAILSDFWARVRSL